MAERLTECIDSHLLDNGEMFKEYGLNSKIELNHFSCMDIQNAVYDKLGELEDLLEKYGVESVEEISKIFSYLSGRFINSVYSLKHKFDSYEDKIKYLANKKGQYYEELYETKQDRDTWQKACELACKELEKRNCFAQDKQTRRIVDLKDYFYQQAKQFAGK